jgi:hypothetical protein
MSLFERLLINFIPIHTDQLHLTKDQWVCLIQTTITKISSKPVGEILIGKLVTFLSQGKKITITNKDPTCTVIFPKINFLGNEVIIVFPNVAYFTETEIIDSTVCEGLTDPFLQSMHKVALGKPAKKKLYLDNYNFLIRFETQPLFISLAHELIHCLRYFEGYDINDDLEEDNTIYGIKSFTLSYLSNSAKIFITENVIRKEWNLGARVSHNAREVFCYGLKSSYVNGSRFSNDSFFN